MPFFRHKEIDRLNFFLTSHCDLKCPDCCMNIPRLKHKEHYSIEYIQNAAKHFYGIRQVNITGGEPTIHPKFKEVVPKLREWFGCEALILATDGCHVKKYAHLLSHFDHILISHYEGNQDKVEFVQSVHTDMRHEGLTYHIPLSHRANDPVPCDRFQGAVAYAHGLVYPCCVVPGPGAPGIPLTENWRQEILAAPLQCESCCFAEERNSPVGMNIMNVYDPAISPSVEGIHEDGWMSKQIRIRMEPTLFQRVKDKHLVFDFETTNHPSFFPVRLKASSENRIIQEMRVQKRTNFQWEVPLDRVNGQSDAVSLLLESDKVFVPNKINPETHDKRELSFRIQRIDFE